MRRAPGGAILARSRQADKRLELPSRARESIVHHSLVRPEKLAKSLDSVSLRWLHGNVRVVVCRAERHPMASAVGRRRAQAAVPTSRLVRRRRESEVRRGGRPDIVN
jgi:hypothetical protein